MSARRLDFAFVGNLAMDRENLPRCLAALGFTARLATWPRGDIRWWQPAYFRMPDAHAIRARHFPAQADRFLASRRETLAPINRAIAAQQVVAMYRAEPEALVMLDTTSGEWRSPDNATRGEDIVSLASYMWRVSMAYACHRLARACGLAEAPPVHG